MLRVVRLGHMVVDFSALACSNVSGRIGSLIHVLLEEWIDLPVELLTFKCVFHTVMSVVLIVLSVKMFKMFDKKLFLIMPSLLFY